LLRGAASFDKDTVQAMTPAEKQNYAVIALTIPEGVTIRRDDGRGELQGEATVYLMVYGESMLASDEMEQTPEDFQNRNGSAEA
jgi:hypothetical protein